jgi:hypothetical protein
MAESNRSDWRELCAAAAKEPDSEKLADLVDQIIKALDARAEGFASHLPNAVRPAVRQSENRPAPTVAR